MLHDWYNLLLKLNARKITNVFVLKIAYILSVISKRPFIWGYPSVITIEPTNQCNLKCIECPSGNGTLTRSKGSIEPALFFNIIDEVSPCLSYLMLYFQGEPFLHPQIKDLVHYANDKKIYVTVSTNGHYLSEKNVKNLIESGLDRIVISLDGIDEESYTVYRKGGNFKKVISGITRLVQFKNTLKSKKPFIVLQFLAMNHNEHQVKDFKSFGEKMGVDKTVIKTIQVTDFRKNKKLIPNNILFSRYSKENDHKIISKNPLKNRCSRIWKSMVILYDGCVVPCCFDKDADFPVGSLKSKNISQIWQSNEFNLFRKNILRNRGKIKMCCNCTEGLRNVYV